MSDHERELDAFLASPNLGRRCRVCASPREREIVALHLSKLRHGKTGVTLRAVHQALIRPRGTKSWDTIKKHVCECLLLNHETGGPLDG